MTSPRSTDSFFDAPPADEEELRRQFDRPRRAVVGVLGAVIVVGLVLAAMFVIRDEESGPSGPEAVAVTTSVAPDGDVIIEVPLPAGAWRRFDDRHARTDAGMELVGEAGPGAPRWQPFWFDDQPAIVVDVDPVEWCVVGSVVGPDLSPQRVGATGRECSSLELRTSLSCGGSMAMVLLERTPIPEVGPAFVRVRVEDESTSFRSQASLDGPIFGEARRVISADAEQIRVVADGLEATCLRD